VLKETRRTLDPCARFGRRRCVTLNKSSRLKSTALCASTRPLAPPAHHAPHRVRLPCLPLKTTFCSFAADRKPKTARSKRAMQKKEAKVRL
jgi:hypothetical protein